MRFSRHEYWHGLPFPPLGDLPNPGIEPVSPALAGEFFTSEPPGKPLETCTHTAMTTWRHSEKGPTWKPRREVLGRNQTCWHLSLGSLSSKTEKICCCLITKSCPTLCKPLDCSRPGSSVHGISQQEYWNGLPFPSPGDLPTPGIKSGSLALQVDSLPSEPPGKSKKTYLCLISHLICGIFYASEIRMKILSLALFSYPHWQVRILISVR